MHRVSRDRTSPTNIPEIGQHEQPSNRRRFHDTSSCRVRFTLSDLRFRVEEPSDLPEKGKTPEKTLYYRRKSEKQQTKTRGNSGPTPVARGGSACRAPKRRVLEKIQGQLEASFLIFLIIVIKQSNTKFGHKDRSRKTTTIPILESIINIQIHHFKTTFMCLRSIAGVPFDSAGRFRASFLLHTTCDRS